MSSRRMLAVMAAVDAAESRGDAWAALDLMESNPVGPDGGPFWSSWRAERLLQIVLLGPLLPAWAVSRWVLAQAHQCLDPANRERTARARQLTIDLLGGAAALPGVDDLDAQCRVMDRDWIYRQLLLYDLGGLRSFLRQAPPDLLATADRIHDWVAAPMAGYRLVEVRCDTITWQDLRTHALLTTANLGAHVDLEPYGTVIGRVVPTGGRPMFESAPLSVPERVAAAVAARPEDWLAVLATCDPLDGERIESSGRTFALCSDVPPGASLAAVLDDHDRLEDVIMRGPTGGELAEATVRLARSTLDDSGRTGPAHLRVWPCLADLLVRPSVITELEGVLERRDDELLETLSERLGEPAAAVCRSLASDLRSAA